MVPPPASKAGRKPPSAVRRVRSESDRKKHAGWRDCPRCARLVSTNGRNFYHHMYKCDRVYFADEIARHDAARPSKPSSSAAPVPSPLSAPVLSPTTPPPVSSSGGSVVVLSEKQRAMFLQQICFLRIFDRAVDAAFSQLEASANRVFFVVDVFKAVRHAKKQNSYSASYISPYIPPCSQPAAGTPVRPYAPVPLPDSLTSPLTLSASSPLPAHSPEPVLAQSLFPPPSIMPQGSTADLIERNGEAPAHMVQSASAQLQTSVPVSTHVLEANTASNFVVTSASCLNVLNQPPQEQGFLQTPPNSEGDQQLQSLPVSSRPPSLMDISSVINN